MSRSGYTDEWDNEGQLWLYRQAGAQAVDGKRGQALLADLLRALDALPVKRLIAHDLECEGDVCALGSLGKMRGMAMENLDPTEPEDVAAAFHVAPSLVQEIAYQNDEGTCGRETAEARWIRMRAWVAEQIRS